MKITAKELEDYSEKELENEHFEIMSELINAGITPKLQGMYRKERIKKIEAQKHNIERLIAINTLLGQTGERNDMYIGFLNSLKGEQD